MNIDILPEGSYSTTLNNHSLRLYHQYASEKQNGTIIVRITAFCDRCLETKTTQKQYHTIDDITYDDTMAMYYLTLAKFLHEECR